MAESFEKLDNILHDWEKISTKCMVKAFKNISESRLLMDSGMFSRIEGGLLDFLCT